MQIRFPEDFLLKIQPLLFFNESQFFFFMSFYRNEIREKYNIDVLCIKVIRLFTPGDKYMRMGVRT